MTGLRVIDIQSRKYFLGNNSNLEEIKPGTVNKLFLKQVEKKSRHYDQKSLTNPKIDKSSLSPPRIITHNLALTEGSQKTKSSPISALLNDVFHSSPTEVEIPGKTLGVSKQNSPVVSPDNSFSIYNPVSLQRGKSSQNQLKTHNIHNSCINLNEKSQSELKTPHRKSPLKSSFLVASNHWTGEIDHVKDQSVSKTKGFKKHLHNRLGISKIFPEDQNVTTKQFSPQFYIKSHKNKTLNDWKQLPIGENKSEIVNILSSPTIKVNNASPKIVMKLKKRVKSLHSSVLLSKAIIAPKIVETTSSNKLFTSQSPQRKRTITISSILEKRSTNLLTETHRLSKLA